MTSREISADIGSYRTIKFPGIFSLIYTSVFLVSLVVSAFRFGTTKTPLIFEHCCFSLSSSQHQDLENADIKRKFPYYAVTHQTLVPSCRTVETAFPQNPFCFSFLISISDKKIHADYLQKSPKVKIYLKSFLYPYSNSPNNSVSSATRNVREKTSPYNVRDFN